MSTDRHVTPIHYECRPRLLLKTRHHQMMQSRRRHQVIRRRQLRRRRGARQRFQPRRLHLGQGLGRPHQEMICHRRRRQGRHLAQYQAHRRQWLWMLTLRWACRRRQSDRRHGQTVV